MFLPRDSNTLSTSFSPRFPNTDKSLFKAIPNSAKRSLEDPDSSDSVTKKRKLLDDKAPGLFDHLTKLVQEETSTEAASVHSSERDSDDHKHHIRIPTPFRDPNQPDNSNLSNTVKANPAKSGTDVLSLSKGTTDSGSMEIEEIQRQKILNMLACNTILLNNVMNQQAVCHKSLFDCMENFKELKGDLYDGQKTHLEKIEEIKKEKKQSNAFDSNPTPANLFKHLFGPMTEFKYELVLNSEIPSPIFRERNLVIKVKLVNSITKEVVKNKNKILLHLGLQTWEIPSNPILRNKTGNKAIMGETDIELTEGFAAFDRIQINEVTSKFIHGHVALLVIPTKPINYGTSLASQDQGEEDYVQYEDIKPLMLEKIVVKSKKKNSAKKKAEKNGKTE